MTTIRRWAAGVVAALALGGCSAGATSGTAVPAGAAAPDAPAVLTLTPADGATGVSPVDPISVAVAGGRLEAVALTSPAGKRVTGTPTEDGAAWTVAEPLGFGKTYTWSGTAVGGDGGRVPVSGEFTTVTPTGTTHASLNVTDDKAYGVAMPIKVTFDPPVTDRAAAERRLAVETSVPTEGSWAWLDGGAAAHWRPKEYWKPHTEVTVTAAVYGVDLGGGVHGDEDVSASFSIGRSQIVKAVTKTHRMIVIRDGKQVHDFPASYGLESDRRRVTRSGVHVVMEKYRTKGMTNPTFGYSDVQVPFAVRIHNNGEFIHGYAPSVASQGRENVSHGCINLSPANAETYFNSVLTGDPVEVVSEVEMGEFDDDYGDYYDWVIPWAEWQKKSALVG
ncbi:Ig-like domain-containing protein [Actinokineospora guangxiensis]|uniref:Ig-like domain-containing protein n=1 Tax=Actinokineospora guangxiensis TaxID=1490288 RepID=A0ABW0EEM1_9PSEU